MAKRRLSKQQQSRINKNQQSRIHKAGTGNKDAQNVDESSLGPELRGLVVARYSRNVDIESLEGERQGETLRCHIRANLQSITTGDYIIWRETPQGEGVVVAIEERQSVIMRPDGYGKLKPVAANIDQVFIVFAVAPEPHPNLIDRYIIAAENANIEAKLIFNKIDLLTKEHQTYQDLLAVYQQLNYQCFEISCETNTGLNEIRQALTSKTSIFVGQSGVGKSSIVNSLLPEVDAKVGALSEHVTKGRHTTTTTTLFNLPNGGRLIDSPGIREFHLMHFSKEDIYAGYRELQELQKECRFRDCQHIEEPDCAVRELIESGQMAASRQQSLEYILNHLDSY